MGLPNQRLNENGNPGINLVNENIGLIEKNLQLLNDDRFKFLLNKNLSENQTNLTVVNQTALEYMNLIKEVTQQYNDILNKSRNIESVSNESLSLRETSIRYYLLLALLLPFISSNISLLLVNRLRLAIGLSTIDFIVILLFVFILTYLFSVYLERNEKELAANTKIIDITKKLTKNLVEQTNTLYNYSLLLTR